MEEIHQKRHVVNWLYCIVFDDNPNDSEEKKGKTDEPTKDEKRITLARRLIKAGLNVEQFFSVQGDKIFMKIGATDARLLLEAQTNDFPLLLNRKSLRELAASPYQYDLGVTDIETGIVNKTSCVRNPLKLDARGYRYTKPGGASMASNMLGGTLDAISNLGNQIGNMGTQIGNVGDAIGDAFLSPNGDRGVIPMNAIPKSKNKYDSFDYLYCNYLPDIEAALLSSNIAESSVYYTYSDGSILSGAARMKLIHMAIERVRVPDPHNGTMGAGISLVLLQEKGHCITWFPLHQETTVRKIDQYPTSQEGTTNSTAVLKEWKSTYFLPWKQPLDLVAGYFGEKVALYFTFLGHYSTWLVMPALFGFVVFIFQMVALAEAVAVVNDPSSDVQYATDFFNLAQIRVENGTLTDVRVVTETAELPYLAGFIALWATFVMEMWKRRENIKVMEWGTTSFEKSEAIRVEFNPSHMMPSEITGELEPYYSHSRRRAKFAVSGVVIFIALASVVGILVTLNFASVLIREFQDNGPPGTQFSPFTLQVITLCAFFLDAVIKEILSTPYAALAEMLNNWENHSTDTQYEDSLIVKRFVFEFVNRYGTLFYIAFIKPSLNGADNGAFCLPILDPGALSALVPGATSVADTVSDNCFGKLGYALVSPLLVMALVDNFKEVFYPILHRMVMKRLTTLSNTTEENTKALLDSLKARSGENKNVNSDESTELMDGIRLRSPCEEDFVLVEYESTIDDYLELAIQFGYCTMFVVSFPLAPTIAFFANILEVWIDSSKLCLSYRRPEVLGARDIGPWQRIFEFMGLVAVVTNMAVILFTTKVFEFDNDAQRVWSFVGAVVAVIFTQLVLAMLLPDVPSVVTTQLERQRYFVRKLVHNEPDEAPDEAVSDLDRTGTDPATSVRPSDPGILELASRVGNQLLNKYGHSRIDVLIEEWDKDGDGEIDRRELAKLLDSLGSAVSDYDVRKLMAALDASGDGQLSKEELRQFLVAVEAATAGGASQTPSEHSVTVEEYSESSARDLLDVDVGPEFRSYLPDL